VIYSLDNLPQDIIIISELFNNPDPGKALENKRISLKVYPISFVRYKEAFDKVIENISHGNSYLLNLTFPSRISTAARLEEIFYCSRAKYRLFYQNKYVVFSPEIFVKIDQKGEIRSFPMKGTIDSSVPEAEKVILMDEKEKSEHNTIVDLIRNDMSMHARNVRLKR